MGIKLNSAAGKLVVAHLANQNHVGILAQDVSQSAIETQGVGANLALIHHRLVADVRELDRVFDCQDVHCAVVVDLVNHGGKRGRLARTGWAGD